MTDFSLVPVEHQPDFDDVSLIPVDHDPFSADGMIQQARTQLESQPQRLKTGTDLINVGAPAIGDGGQFSAGTAIVNKAADIAGKVAFGAIKGLATLPQRALEASAVDVQHLGKDGYIPQSTGPAAETAMMISGFPKPLSRPSRLVPGTRDADLLASRSAGMYDPPVKSPRPFAADYPAGASGEVRAPLTKDIEGRPLEAPFIGGRKVVGGSDEAIAPAQYDAISTAGIGTRPEGYPARALPGKTVGAYRTEAGPDGPVRSIVYDQSLNKGSSSKVVAHEIGHMIDDLPVGSRPPDFPTS